MGKKTKRYVGLTEKRMANRRFKRTEEAILKAFFEEEYYIGISEVAKKVGISRTTIYNHHRAVREILPDYEKYILKQYDKVIKTTLKSKNVGMRMVFFRLLCFIMQNKRVFGMLLKNNHRAVLERMVVKFKGKIINYARLPNKSDKMMMIFLGEVTKLIEEWAKNGFKEDEIEKVICDMMYLTDTMKVRLRPIERI